MQDGRTALELAVECDRHTTVEYFISKCKMDISQFDEVCNNDTVYCACIVIVGVTVWGSIICYTTNEYACTSISSSYSSGGLVSINWTMLRCPYEREVIKPGLDSGLEWNLESRIFAHAH